MSPRGSLASAKTTKLKGKAYQAKQQKINKILEELEVDSSIHHSEHLDKWAALLSLMLKVMSIGHILSLSEIELDFLNLFGKT